MTDPVVPRLPIPKDMISYSTYQNPDGSVASDAGAGLWQTVHRWRPPANHSPEKGMSLLLDHSSRGRIPLADMANLLADA